jgi:hypothetical protein
MPSFQTGTVAQANSMSRGKHGNILKKLKPPERGLS